MPHMNREVVLIGLACAAIFILVTGVWWWLEDEMHLERVAAGVYALGEKMLYWQWGPGPTSSAGPPTALPKPTLASPSPADASVLANPEVIGLLDVLRRHGIALENPSESRVAFLYPVPGAAYRVGRGGLAFHPFPNREAAEKRANEILNELTRPSLGEWVDQPHFYRCQSTLVLYLGKDARVMQALEESCGPPFAGS